MTDHKKRDEQAPRDAGGEDAAEDTSVEGRRKVLRRLLVGGGIVGASTQLPDKWTKPLMDSVLVPAHAQTSATPQPTLQPTPGPAVVVTPAPTPGPTVTATSSPTPSPTGG